MRKSALKGTRDFLPQEVRLRDYMQNRILEVYQRNGFDRISTPILEDIENLDKSEGGENLNLIFRVLKRGEKLKNALEQGKMEELCDIGLRYDLTLPLSRYYANNKDKLLSPMKCIQIDRVYRAERPQRGRDREFIQCDIDILGSASLHCEIELINTTAKALKAVGIDDFTIRLNDRRLLKAVLMAAGVEEDRTESVCISIDKLDKIGVQGLAAELGAKGLKQEVIGKISDILCSTMGLSELEELTGEGSITRGLREILRGLGELSSNTVDIRFDLTLVRGQGYYTGTIFEIESKRFKGSIGGGGRYDNLIGKFSGEAVPAVGFSIGFERIYAILSENGFELPDMDRKMALIYREEDFLEASLAADQYRKNYDVCLYQMPVKLGKFIDRLARSGCRFMVVYGEGQEVRRIE